MKRFRLAVLIVVVLFVGLLAFLWFSEGGAEIARWSTEEGV